MKSFKNIKALTFAELLVSLAISGAIFGIVIYFTMVNINEIAGNQVKTKLIQEVVTIQDKFSEFVLSGLDSSILINQEIDSTYTKTNPNPNNILVLENSTGTGGLLIGVVNLDTKKIQKNYVYGDNFIGFRELTNDELSQIKLDKNKVYEKEFLIDKMFLNFRVKDFKITQFNDGKIIDMSFVFVKKLDKEIYNKDFNEIFIDDLIIGDYTLAF